MDNGYVVNHGKISEFHLCGDNMRIPRYPISRRSLLLGVTAIAASHLLWPGSAMGGTSQPLTRKIPSSGEAIPMVGLGSWITFNVGRDTQLLDECTEVMAAFFEAGGG